jgi:hypothetical protein
MAALPILLALAASIGAGPAQEAPAPAPPAPPPAAEAPIAPSAESVRAKWLAMTSGEREEIERHWTRWRELPQEDREALSRRHQRLQKARRRERESLGEDLPREWQRMDERSRERELSRRALNNLRGKFDSLPPELRDRLQQELPAVLPRDRERRAKQAIEPYLDFAVPELVRHLVERGELPPPAAAEFTRKLERDPAQRLALVKQLIADHAQTFRVPPEDAERVRRADDPGAGLRVLDQLRRRRGRGDGPLLPRLPRFPRDGQPPRDGPQPREGQPPRDGPPFREGAPSRDRSRSEHPAPERPGVGGGRGDRA